MKPNDFPPKGDTQPKRPGDYEGPGRTHHVPKKDHYDMDVKSYFGNLMHNEAFKCYCLEDITYCTAPVNTDMQCMNIMIPEAYVNSDGKIDANAVCGDYTAATAPIIVQSAVMGYSEAAPVMLRAGKRVPDQSLIEQFIRSGMIYVSAGTRGRQTQGEDGSYVGKAPALLLDVKAAIRFYRHNKAVLPGNTDRIIFVGISAGGNLASLVGTTCDHPYFTKGLEKMGAVMDESDSVYAIQAFCPISDLSHADMAYEWMFQGRNKLDIPPFMKDAPKSLTPFQCALSKALGDRYPAYVNSLGLTHPVTGEPLTLNNGYNGTMYDYLITKLEDSATKYINYIQNGPDAPGFSVENYLDGNYTTTERRPNAKPIPGINKRSWLSWDGERAHITSLKDMEDSYIQRMKNCPSFDSLELTEFENEEFGPSDKRVSHFDVNLAEVLATLKEDFPDEYNAYYPALAEAADDELLKEQNYALNPLNFISKTDDSNLCTYYRIRVGSRDAHTSFTTAMLVAVSLMNAGKPVDFEYTWDMGHGVCDYEGALCQWIKSIC